MKYNPITAISPIDGRYYSTTLPLVNYFSELALMRYRVLVEIEYFIFLCQIPLPELASFPKEKFSLLRSWYENFNEQDCSLIKDIEKIKNHDVKSVEYFIRAKFKSYNLTQFAEFIHFGLTSQDINNTAIPLSIKEFLEKEFITLFNKLIARLEEQTRCWKDVAMLSRTHGQPASPTRVGKEIAVFTVRLKNQLSLLTQVDHAAKFGGAVGNFNAHNIAYPNMDWLELSNKFVSQSLGLVRSHPTTQIEHYDLLATLCDNLKRINTILIDYSRDMWHYISLNYFVQKIEEKEVGSSAMPHKINPIDFENAEGNLGFANAMFEHFSAKLPISRLQRDLTDSTVLRNVGVPFAHTFIALHSLIKGINKLELNSQVIATDLDSHWNVLAEAIQTILRREGVPESYEILKSFTRNNNKLTKENLKSFIETLPITNTVKRELLELKPSTYIGI